MSTEEKVRDQPQAPALSDREIEERLQRLLDSLTQDEPSDGRIIVQAYLPHMKEYGMDPMRDLVYAKPAEQLAVGDLVLCPPTPKRPTPFEAIVVALDGSNHPYKGPVKKIIRKVS